jgi:predicted flavoprotein YhiN
MKESKTVAIFGAGAGGLVSAKLLLDDGFNVTLFERQRELGGIWSAESAYADLHSQQPGGTFEFSDLFDGAGKIYFIIVINSVFFKLKNMHLGNLFMIIYKNMLIYFILQNEFVFRLEFYQFLKMI